tara:strand:+ start:123 stop:929 length:807 start_codon:yes stop_codon:yes gene_type:complete
MIHETPFGMLTPSIQADTKKIGPVHRALRWCEVIAKTTLWNPKSNGTNTSLQRTINGQLIEIFPLEAACIDLGMQSKFSANHLPIYLNGSDACVRSKHSKPRPLHTDMVASMILLLGRAEFNPGAVPRTLHSILTAKQIQSLPSFPPYERFVAGRPSTSGREFLPEARILELVNQHPNVIFSIQFEMRNGNLRNMTAREEVGMVTDGDESNSSTCMRMSYNPSDYHLKTVFDMQKEQYRNIATDRVTRISIGEHTQSTASAQEGPAND